MVVIDYNDIGKHRIILCCRTGASKLRQDDELMLFHVLHKITIQLHQMPNECEYVKLLTCRYLLITAQLFYKTLLIALFCLVLVNFGYRQQPLFLYNERNL